MLSKKTTLVCLIFVVFSCIIALNNTNDEGTQPISQTPIEVDDKPKASYQTYNELWIDNSSFACGNGTWTDIAATYSWCVDVNGDGSLYLIEDITLNNPDGVGSPLIIANSTVDFIIQNCTFTNSEASYGDAGIKLLNASNGNIYSSNISDNNGAGIFLYEYCENITVKNNTLNRNDEGIYFRWQDNYFNKAINNTIIDSTVSGIAVFGDDSIVENNTIIGAGSSCIAADAIDIVLRNNSLSGDYNGIYASAFSENLIISGNTMTNVGINLTHNDVFTGMEIFTNNTVNGKPVYFYRNQVGLDTANFTSLGDPGQILLLNCDYTTISNLNISYTSMAIQLYDSSHNNITDNFLRDNDYGIKLSYDCTNTTIMNNTVKNSQYMNIQLKYYNYNNTIIGNKITGGGVGINLYHLNDDNEISNNEVTLTGYAGIEVRNCDNVNITHNTANENDIGILPTANIANSLVYNNTCNDNLNVGIYLNGAGDNNLIIENNCTNTAAGLSQARGIYLSGTEWNDIINNTIHGNNDEGIFGQSNCYFNNISFNDIRFGNGNGIHLAGACENNTMYKNNVSENSEYGIWIEAESDGCSIVENEIINNGYSGVFIAGSDKTYVYNNDIIHNGYSAASQGGIYIDEYVVLYSSLWNNITDNDILDNDDFGIYLYDDADWNNITFNNIMNNTYGILTYSNSDYNMIVLNNFTGNTIHAWEVTSDNFWNNATYGNYWDNYTGDDDNDNGIGDTPHAIPGGGGAVDLYPIWWDGTDPPVITIISPTEGQLRNATVPIFNVQITGSIDEQWFSFFNGSIWTDNASWTGVEIDQTMWNTAPNGSVIVRFWANNSYGETLAERFLYKDIFAPNITNVTPANLTLCKKSERDFNLYVREYNNDTMWYTIEGAGHYEFTQNGTFNQAAWDAAWDATSDGATFTIRFYANDSAGNIKYVDILITVDKSDEGGEKDDDDDGEGDNKPEIFDPFIVFLIIGSIAAATTMTLYYYNKRTKPKKISKMRKSIKPSPSPHTSKKILDELNDPNELMALFNENVAPEDIEKNKVTFVSEKFLSKLDISGLTDSEKKEFLKEMLALDPDERNEIINKMLKKRTN